MRSLKPRGRAASKIALPRAEAPVAGNSDGIAAVPTLTVWVWFCSFLMSMSILLVLVLLLTLVLRLVATCGEGLGSWAATAVVTKMLREKIEVARTIFLII